MAKFKKDGKRETPAISTASLPDIVFMLLFFFMVSTTMREVSLMVANAMPQATETVKLEKKSLVSNIYVCLLYTSPSPRDRQKSRMPSSA